jgi:hypothetical protein
MGSAGAADRVSIDEDELDRAGVDRAIAPPNVEINA